MSTEVTQNARDKFIARVLLDGKMLVLLLRQSKWWLRFVCLKEAMHPAQ